MANNMANKRTKWHKVDGWNHPRVDKETGYSDVVIAITETGNYIFAVYQDTDNYTGWIDYGKVDWNNRIKDPYCWLKIPRRDV